MIPNALVANRALDGNLNLNHHNLRIVISDKAVPYYSKYGQYYYSNNREKLMTIYQPKI